MKTYRVEVVEIASNKVVAVIGKGLDKRKAEKREETGLRQVNTEDYFVRSVEEK